MKIMEAYAQGIREQAPKTERTLAEYRTTDEFRRLPLHDQKMVGLLHWTVKQMTEHR